jgi:hypothetical protein
MALAIDGRETYDLATERNAKAAFILHSPAVGPFFEQVTVFIGENIKQTGP